MNKEEALKLLNEEGSLAPDNRWISHSICVGDTASVIAEKLNLDKEKARVLGYIHDIGKATPAFQTKESYNHDRDLDYDLLEHLLRNGFTNLDKYYLNTDGEPYALVNEDLYTLSEWLDGRECSLAPYTNRSF